MGIQGRGAPSRLVFLPLPQPSHPNLKQLAFSTTSLEPRELDDLEGHFHGVTRAFTPDLAIPSYRARSTYPRFSAPFPSFHPRPSTWFVTFVPTDFRPSIPGLFDRDLLSLPVDDPRTRATHQ